MRIALLISTLAIFAAPALALAQGPSPESIRCSLDPSCQSPGQAPPSQPGIKRRSIDPSVGVATPKSNAIDLNVAFEFNSAILQNDARITLDSLGKALSDPSLAGYAFLIGGHTDAKGRPSYNQVLSERRAQAVREYLVTHYSIPESRLTAKGFGSVQLIDPDHPEGERNRRVQIVNMTAAPTAH
jgi:outer membrane protein OmpA-like peptidoglycan-associated protein